MAIEIIAESREKAKTEALRRLELPEEAVELEFADEEDDLLPGAKPMVHCSASIRPEYVGEKVKETAAKMLDLMDLDYEIEATDVAGITLVSIETEKADVLIGFHGETLDAFQHLVVRMARLSGREVPLVLLDVSDYRRKRIERLQRVADELVADVLESGEEEHFDPMDAVDRKIVHTLLKGKPGIKTFSRGEDFKRHVIIAPEG